MNNRIKRTTEELRENRQVVAEALKNRELEAQEVIRKEQESRTTRCDLNSFMFGMVCRKGFIEYITELGRFDLYFGRQDIISLLSGRHVKKECGNHIIEFVLDDISTEEKIRILRYSTMYQDLVNLV